MLESFDEVGTVLEMVFGVADHGRQYASHFFSQAAKDGVAGRDNGAHRQNLFVYFRIAEVERRPSGAWAYAPVDRWRDIALMMVSLCALVGSDGGFV